MKEVLLYIWQLPQNILGFLLYYLFFALDRIDWFYERDGILYAYITGLDGGISLGRYVLCEKEWQHYIPQTNEKHEYGHCLQSRKLGPLYLIVIALPSLIHSAFYKEATPQYWKFFTERWADKLGGVRR